MASPQTTKSERVKSLIKTSGYSSRDIAEIAGCSPELVRVCRRSLRAPSERETLVRKVARLEEEVRELSRVVLRLARLQRSQRLTRTEAIPRA